MKLVPTILAATALAVPFAPVWSQDGDDPLLTASTVQEPCLGGCLTPIEAVTFASQMGARAGIAGRFAMTVKAVGERGETIYLNSEPDYRDRNCLTIALPKPIAKRVFGSTALEALQQRLLERKIVVSGVARQVRIDFTVDGQPTGKYYYQVHARVMDPRQFLDVPPAA